MAFTAAPSATVKYVLIDETGSTGFCLFHIPAATTNTAALAAAATLATNLAAITGCMVQSYGITYAMEENAPGGPVTGARVEHKGRFLWQLANGLGSKTEVPGILPAVVLTDGALDLNDPSVDTFVTGIASGAIFCGADGSDITAINGAYEAFRRSTRRQLPTRRLV
jgi:hypothetical protein